MLNVLTLIAQATSTPAGGKPAGGDTIFGFIVPMALVMIVLFYFTTRGQKKERDKHQKMLNSLKRNDRVITIGGVFGSVVEVREHEVVIKVDESNNTKMRFARTAIKEVLAGGEPAPETPKK